MDWANVTKIHTLPSTKRYPPEEHALYKDNFHSGNGELLKVIADIKTASHYRCSSVVH